MIKKIAIDQLKPGMHIHDLNFGWADHPFARSDFMLEDERSVDQIRKLGIRELYIDNEKGLDVDSAPTRSEVVEVLEQEMEDVAAASSAPDHPTSLAEEMRRARVIQREAAHVIRRCMDQARMGKPLDLRTVTPLVEEMIASISRNQDALLGLTRIRRVGRYTLEHSFNVAAFMIAFARTLQLEPPVCEEIAIGALLHDLGKALTPDEIINKPGALTDRELAIIHQHVVHTREILQDTPGIGPVALALAGEHHERIDGSGYPEGKRGDAISRYGQMAAIVDVYDALTADRVYQLGEEPHQALRRLLEWSRHHFDARLVQQFIRCIGIYPVGSLVRLHSEQIGVVVESGRANLLQPIVRIVMDAVQRRPLATHDLDLSLSSTHDRILGPESPAHWRIRPEIVLQQTP